MKTVAEIDKEITDLIKLVEKKDRKEQLKVQNKISFLRKAKLYLESNPRLEFIQSQKEDCLKHIKSIETNFELWKIGRCLSTYKDVYASYCSQMDMGNYKSQLKYLEYLLA